MSALDVLVANLRVHINTGGAITVKAISQLLQEGHLRISRAPLFHGNKCERCGRSLLRGHLFEGRVYGPNCVRFVKAEAGSKEIE